MRVGLNSPVVVQLPGISADWEAAAGGPELAAIAEAADRLGFAHLTCSEHVAVPEARATERGSTYWDPLATLSYLAARTARVRLVTNVVVLGYHHPLAIAKRYGTLDRLSAGRLVLGVGVGTLEEEFDLLGAAFEGRGERADDALRAIRTSLSVAVADYNGSHYSFAGMVVEPHAVQTRVPIWVGGRTKRSLRRAVDLGDGWVPMMLRPEECRQMLDQHDLPHGFEVVLGPGRPLDPGGEPERVGSALARLSAAGATVANVTLVSRSAGHYLEQMEALAEMVPQ